LNWTLNRILFCVKGGIALAGLVALDMRGYKKEESSKISQACLANGPAHQFIEYFLFLFHHEQVIRDKKAAFCDSDL